MITQVSIYVYDTCIAHQNVNTNIFALSSFTFDTTIYPFNVSGTYQIKVVVWGSECRVHSEKMGNVIVIDSVREMFSAEKVTGGRSHTVILGPDGTAVVFGRRKGGSQMKTNQLILKGWDNIIDIVAGDYHTIGLRTEGTVVAVGREKENQSDVETWRDIVDIAAGDYHTVGLRAGGMSLVATGRNKHGQYDVQNMIYAGAEPIISVAAG